MMADSTLITKSFVAEGWIEDFNQRLAPMERARDLSVRALLEEKVYFYHVCYFL